MTEGGCLCGAVRYRVDGEPLIATLCHCRSCCRASGAPAVAWVVWRAEEFAFTAGTPRRFSSSPAVERTFCGVCGTALTYRHDARPDRIDTTTVSLDDAEAFAPSREIWLEHKLGWEPVDERLPQYPRSSAGAA